jgi:hypothetical protein
VDTGGPQTRDGTGHEQQRLHARIDEARMTKLLAEVEPLAPKL